MKKENIKKVLDLLADEAKEFLAEAEPVLKEFEENKDKKEK